MTSGSNLSFTVGDTSGKADAGTYSVVVKDNAFGCATAPFTVTEEADAATKLSPSAANGSLSAANPATSFSAQVIDENGNAVQVAGIPVVFNSVSGSSAEGSFAGGTMGFNVSYTAYTNAEGVASANFNSQAYDGKTWSVTATPAAGYGLNTTPATTSVTVLYTATSALKVAVGSQDALLRITPS